MCMFKCNTTKIIGKTRVGYPENYKTPIPIISFKKYRKDR